MTSKVYEEEIKYELFTSLITNFEKHNKYYAERKIFKTPVNILSAYFHKNPRHSLNGGYKISPIHGIQMKVFAARLKIYLGNYLKEYDDVSKSMISVASTLYFYKFTKSIMSAIKKLSGFMGKTVELTESQIKEIDKKINNFNTVFKYSYCTKVVFKETEHIYLKNTPIKEIYDSLGIYFGDYALCENVLECPCDNPEPHTHYVNKLSNDAKFVPDDGIKYILHRRDGNNKLNIMFQDCPGCNIL